MTVAVSILDDLRLIPGYDPFATAGDCEFDEEAATLAVEFVEQCCVHIKGNLAGQALMLEPWERAIVGNLFGWKRPDGSRRYREALIFVPRKNGKTTLTAAIALTVLFIDHEPGAECYCAAADREQAAIVYSIAAEMVRKDSDMHSLARIYPSTKTITYKREGSFLRAISAEVGGKFGYNSHLVIIDELHTQKTRELVDAMITSTASKNRIQPLVIHLTTSDYERGGSICNEKHDYACKVRDGLIDDPYFLPAVYEASLDDDWTSPEVWAKANPNLDVSLSREYLQRECKRAQEEPAFENEFKRLHLNIRTEQAVRWLKMDEWDACAGPVDPEALAGHRCYAGLDLSSTSDTTALVLLFPDDGNALLPFFWIPSDNARERERRDRVPYLTWAKQGLIDMTPGDVIDYRYIRQRCVDLSKKYKVVEIAYDPYNATQLATQLQDEDGLTMVLFRQGWATMNEPTKHFEVLVRRGELAHGGNPVLRWQASNVAVYTQPPDNVRPAKDKSFEKIDGIVAAIMAVGRGAMHTEPKSVYDTRGPLFL